MTRYISRRLLMLSLLALLGLGLTASNACAATAQVTVKGPTSFSYTVQLWQNNKLIAQDTNFRLPMGVRTRTWTGVTAGCGYTANVFVNGVNIESHTWPAKCVNGTTLLGCLAFNGAGEPTPWTGTCRAY